MQMMFSTINMGIPNNNQFQQTPKQVVIDNNQVDFFNQPSSSTKQPQPINNNKAMDFFSLDQPVSKPQNFTTNSNNNNNQLSYTTGLHQMFATQNTNNLGGGFEFNNQNNMNFLTNTQNNNSNNTSKPFALLQGFGLDNGNNNVNLNQNVNVTQNISTQGFETTNLGMLFTTQNNLPIHTNNNTNNVSLSLNQTHFSTGINMNNQNNQSNINTYSTGFNMNNNMKNQINFSTPTQPNMPQVDINQINMNDLNSIQMLFQANSMGMNMSQPTSSNNTNSNINTSSLLNMNQQPQPNSKISLTTTNPPQPPFSSSFNTTMGVLSPSMLGMNTYSDGNINKNFNLSNNSFNNPNDQRSQFATSTNINKNNPTPSFQKKISKVMI